MLKGIDVRQKINFSLPGDTEPKTVFVLRPLTSIEMMEFSDVNNESKTKALKFYIETSLVEIQNFVTDNVKEVVDCIDTKTLGELIGKLNEINHLTQDEAKNS
jgi:predicted transcriptional regulator of viral defense system